nr:putative pectate lyase 2 [Coffea arabica]
MNSKSKNVDHLPKCYSIFPFIPIYQIFSMAQSSHFLVLSRMLAIICCFSTFQALQIKSTSNQDIGFNAIDTCWRKHGDWATNRQALADCAKGYGAGAQGGKNGATYVVTDPSDDPINPKKGTLRYGAIQREPLWIVFQGDMNLKLKDVEIFVNSYKTIDGRGARVEIGNGPCLRINDVEHVIVHGINFRKCLRGIPGLVRIDPDHLLNTSSNGVPDGDGIRILSSSHVWIDHCHFSNCADGLLDISHKSTAVTVSNNYFTQHDKAMLLGHSDKSPQDNKMYVTLVLNHFASGLTQRIPRVRYGYVHVANNKYDEWGMYAIGGSSCPTILSEANYYRAKNDSDAKQVTRRISNDPGWKNWSWNSKDDVFLNGAYFVSSGNVWTPNYAASQAFELAPGGSVPILTLHAGPLQL